jgi:hypothetical protein
VPDEVQAVRIAGETAGGKHTPAETGESRDRAGAQIGLSDHWNREKGIRAQHPSGGRDAVLDHVQNAGRGAGPKGLIPFSGPG